MSAATVDIFPTILDGVHNVFQQRLDDKEQRQKVVAALMEWLTLKARKKPVPDLQARLDAMQVRVKKLVEGMKIEIKDDKPVVIAAGSDEDTLKAFRLGTSWFESNDRLMETVLFGLFDE